MRVYPRTRGGTTAPGSAVLEGDGLSPHTRGNHAVHGELGAAMGSIPAHAGEPLRGTWSGPKPRVYPRTRGGTDRLRVEALWNHGLSPHTRGNPRRAFRRHHALGSIPAHAGEPFRHRRPRRSTRVYPRTRGGTAVCTSVSVLPRGLSPHTRGNRATIGRDGKTTGSIPAHAGEPRSGSGISATLWVYPRTRGGTPYSIGAEVFIPGLSPHTRGNRCTLVNTIEPCRSIPAHAGEPPPCKSLDL